jgi:hypothetical protein
MGGTLSRWERDSPEALATSMLNESA